MNCEEIVLSFPDVVAGRASAEVRAAVEAHVAECAECSAGLDIVRHLEATPPTVAFPEGLESRLLDAARSELAAMHEVEPSEETPVIPLHPQREEEAGARRARWQMPSWAMGAAALLVLALGTPLLVDRMQTSESAVPMTDPVEVAVDEPLESVFSIDDGMFAGDLAIDALTDEELALLLEDLGE